jgi:gluconolactonase
MRKACFFPCLISLVALSAMAQSEGKIVVVDPSFKELIAPDAKIEKLGGGLMFTEGPVWVPQGGYLLFSDVPGNVILKWTPGKGVSDFRRPVFPGNAPKGAFMGSNGLILDKQGLLISCEHGNRRVARTEKDGKITVLTDRFLGKKLNSPNDAVYRSNGDLYFTDPPYGLVKQDDDPAKELQFNGVYRLRANGQLDLMVKEMTRPNGIGFSPDEKKLYIANSDAAKKIWMVYDVALDGALSNGKVFYDVTKETAEGLPDGLKVDKKGNVWATGPGGIWVFSGQGKLLGKVQPTEVPANCNFGEADGKALFMTARTGLYRVRVK